MLKRDNLSFWILLDFYHRIPLFESDIYASPAESDTLGDGATPVSATGAKTRIE